MHIKNTNRTQFLCDDYYNVDTSQTPVHWLREAIKVKRMTNIPFRTSIPPRNHLDGNKYIIFWKFSLLFLEEGLDYF